MSIKPKNSHLISSIEEVFTYLSILFSRVDLIGDVKGRNQLKLTWGQVRSQISIKYQDWEKILTQILLRLL